MISTKSLDNFDQVNESSFNLYPDEDRTDHIKSLPEYYIKFSGYRELCVNESYDDVSEKLSLEDAEIRRGLMNYRSLSYPDHAETKERTLDNSDDDGLIEKYASDSCIDFCNSLGIINLLRTVFQQIRQTFSNVQHLCADVDYFDDDEGEEDIQRYIAISLEVTSSQETVFEEYDQWTNWLIEELSPEEITYFSLTFRRR